MDDLQFEYQNLNKLIENKDRYSISKQTKLDKAKCFIIGPDCAGKPFLSTGLKIMLFSSAIVTSCFLLDAHKLIMAIPLFIGNVFIINQQLKRQPKVFEDEFYGNICYKYLDYNLISESKIFVSRKIDKSVIPVEYKNILQKMLLGDYKGSFWVEVIETINEINYLTKSYYGNQKCLAEVVSKIKNESEEIKKDSNEINYLTKSYDEDKKCIAEVVSKIKNEREEIKKISIVDTKLEESIPSVIKVKIFKV